LIAAMTRVKSYLDYGAFTPIQAAACARSTARRISSRRTANSIASAATCWSKASPAPAGTSLPPRLDVRLGSAAARAQGDGEPEFSKQLLTHAAVAVAPGVGYGEEGEGFVRIALVENEQRLRQAARNIRRYLQSMGVNASAA
jgi:alanine-synthesizing transaminase